MLEPSAPWVRMGGVTPSGAAPPSRMPSPTPSGVSCSSCRSPPSESTRLCTRARSLRLPDWTRRHVVITVEAIHLAPVKSLGLVHPNTVHVERHGIVEDRRLYVIDQQGRLVTQRTHG